MSKFVKWHGQKFKITNEDDQFVTLEGYGYKKRVRKEEVIYEDEIEDDLIDSLPEDQLPNERPIDDLKDEYDVDDGLKLSEDDIISQVDPATAKRIASLNQDKAKLKDKESQIDSKISSLSKSGMKKKEAEEKRNRQEREQMYKQTDIDQTDPVMETEGENQMEREPRDLGNKDTTMPSSTRDKYDEFNVDVDSVTPSDIKKTNNERLKYALEGLRTNILEKLNEFDDMLGEEDDSDVFEENVVDNDMEPENAQVIIDPDAEKQSQDVNYRNTDNDQVNLDVDEMSDFNQVNENNEFETAIKVAYSTISPHNPKPLTNIRKFEDELGEEIINELLSKNIKVWEDVIGFANDYGFSVDQLDECGTAAVAGPGVADGTVSQSINATQGIADVPSPLGMKRRDINQYNESIKEYFKIEDEFILNEGRGQSALNRHWLADKVEESIDPLTESECSTFQRRKARRNAIGNNATLRECACFIAENKFSCDEGKYVPREKPLQDDVVLESLKKHNSKLMRRFRKA